MHLYADKYVLCLLLIWEIWEIIILIQLCILFSFARANTVLIAPKISCLVYSKCLAYISVDDDLQSFRIGKTLPNFTKANSNWKLTPENWLVSKLTDDRFLGRYEFFLLTSSLHFPFSWFSFGLLIRSTKVLTLLLSWTWRIRLK